MDALRIRPRSHGSALSTQLPPAFILERMQHLRDAWLGNMIDQRLSQPKIFRRRDLQVHRRTRDDMNWLPEPFDQLSFVGRLKITTLCERIE